MLPAVACSEFHFLASLDFILVKLFTSMPRMNEYVLQTAWQAAVTEEEIDAVAEELAKVGGISWYPGRSSGPVLRALSERYRDRARVAIAALARLRAGRSGPAGRQSSAAESRPRRAERVSDESQLRVGTIVVYRPPGDQRAVTCTIERLDHGRAYLVPCPRPDFGWVSLDDLVVHGADGDAMGAERKR